MYQSYEGLLRRSLLANAVFSVLCGLVLSAWPASIADYLLIQPHASLELLGQPFLRWVGIGLVLFSLSVAYAGSRRILSKLAAEVIIAADFVWVLASIGLLVFYSEVFSTSGWLIVMAIGLAVLVFALCQLVGMLILHHGQSRISKRRQGTALHLQVARAIDAPNDVIWQVMTDHDSYSAFARNLSRIEVLEGDGLGMIRRCYGARHESWTEEAHIWESGKRYGFQIHTQAEDYPYPLERLEATWSIQRNNAGSNEVVIDFLVIPLDSFKGRIFVGLGSFTFPKLLDEILHRWQVVMEGEQQPLMSAVVS